MHNDISVPKRRILLSKPSPTQVLVAQNSFHNGYLDAPTLQAIGNKSAKMIEHVQAKKYKVEPYYYQKDGVSICKLFAHPLFPRIKRSHGKW